MNKSFLVILLVSFLLLSNIVFADVSGGATASAMGIKESKSIDIYFGFEPAISSTTWYNKTLNFTPVDRVSEVISANIRVIVGQAGKPTHMLLVNDTMCNVYSITSSIQQAQYVADFDCKNVINGSGIYKISYSSTLAVSNAHYRAYITWTNDPDFITAEQKRLFIEDQFRLVSNHDYCIDNDTLGRNLTFEISVDNRNTSVFKTENVTCKFGCDFNRSECIQDPAIRYIIIIVIVLAVIFLILILRRYA